MVLPLWAAAARVVVSTTGKRLLLKISKHKSMYGVTERSVPRLEFYPGRRYQRRNVGGWVVDTVFCGASQEWASLWWGRSWLAPQTTL